MRAAEAITEADARYLCSCGCGDEINPVVRAVDEGIERGLNHRQIALRLQISTSYVSRMLNPKHRTRFVMGHAARMTIWVDASCRCCGRTFRSAGEFQAYCQFAECQSYRWLSDNVGEDEAGAFRQRYVKRIQRMADEQRGSRVQRAAQREYEQAERRTMLSLFNKGVRSLNAILRKSDDYDGGAEGEWLRVVGGRLENATEAVVEQNERAAVIRSLLGDADIDDVLRMNDSELMAIRRKLIDAGIVPGGVQQSERERLRDPQRHAGASIAKGGRGGGGRRTRKQQQAVTRQHKVREMTIAQKQAHSARRATRQRPT